MKFKVTTALFVLIAMMGPSLAQTQTKYVLKVKGMTCPFCAYGLEKKLKKVKGVEAVEIDLEEDQATVVVKEGASVSEDALRKAVRKAGFTLASIEKVDSESPQPPDAENNGDTGHEGGGMPFEGPGCG